MIQAAMIGLGRWGQTILDAVQNKSDRIRFVHGVSKDPDEGRAVAEKHGLKLSTDLQDALADRAVEAVFLATPHSLHLEQIKAVARAGKPVWCEKPLCLTRAAAVEAVTAVREARVPLGTGTNKRCFSSMRELQRLVHDGILGDILHIEGHFSNEHSTRVRGGWRDDPRESPGGGLTGAGLHVLDAFVNLVGPIREVDARLYSHKPPPDPRDALAVLVEFQSGATGLMATVRAAPMYWRVHIFGTNGSAEARGEDTLVVSEIGRQPETRIYEHVDPVRTLVEAFADTIEGKALFPVTVPQILDMLGAFEAILTSIELRKPVVVPDLPVPSGTW
ncbi:MAG TPA: Gfo/Idh/MocA family oxidoreductase [Xanthobacteraceae bacterium]|nr:Gfo/Idh/MocA family oxidoreductase [Xanthobacteraceae bacterium]